MSAQPIAVTRSKAVSTTSTPSLVTTEMPAPSPPTVLTGLAQASRWYVMTEIPAQMTLVNLRTVVRLQPTPTPVTTEMPVPKAMHVPVVRVSAAA